MAVTPAVQEFLRQSNIAYTTFRHRPAFTAAEDAAVTHTPPVRWAKTVACFADGRPILAVVPATFLVDLQRLAEVASAASVRLAREDEFESLFPGCEAGAMPPFGPLYHQRVFLEATLAMEQVMVFHAGTHRDAVRMHVADFVDLVGPVMARFGAPRNTPHETCRVGQHQSRHSSDINACSLGIARGGHRTFTRRDTREIMVP